MPSIDCPKCQSPLQVLEEHVGQQVHCRWCGQLVTVPGAPTGFPSPTAGPVPGVAAPTRPAPKPKSSALKILGILALVGGVCLLACCGLGYFIFVYEIEEPVTEQDRQRVITAERVAQQVPTVQVDPSRGKLRKARHLDGSRDLNYEYESLEGAGEVLSVQCQVYVDKSAQGAKDAYAGLGIGAKFGLQLGGQGQVTEVDRNDLWRWGDDSRCSLIMSNGQKVGNTFMARKGKHYFLLMIVGVYFEDKEAINELLSPMLKNLETFEK